MTATGDHLIHAQRGSHDCGVGGTIIGARNACNVTRPSPKRAA
jgi:hypothetical protein